MATRTIADGGGNWSAVGTWVEGAVPTNADDVVATATSGNLVMDASAVCRSIDFTSYVGIWSGSATLGIGTSSAPGSAVALKLAIGMTVTYTGQITFQSTVTGNTVTCAGRTINSNLVFNGAGGGWTLQDDILNGSGRTINVARGTFNSNGKTITTGQMSISAANTRTVTLTNSTINLTITTATVTVMDATTTTLLTFTATGSTININATVTGGTATFAGGGLTWGTVNWTGGGTRGLTITGANTTFAALNVSAGGSARTLTLPSGSTTTISGTSGLTLAGSLGAVLSLVSSSAGTAATISCASGTCTANFTTLKDSTATGGASFQATNSTLSTNVTGWTVIAAGAAADSAVATDALLISKPAHAADSAVATDAPLISLPAHDAALASDALLIGKPVHAADSAVATESTLVRQPGHTDDAALAADAWRPSTQPAKSADAATAVDVVGNVEPTHAIDTSAGLLGHPVLGWWVLGNGDEGQVRLDAINDPSSATPVSSLSWLHSVADSPNGLLVVQVGLANATGQHVTSVTWNGLPLQLAIAEGTAPMRSEMWYLSVPPAGTGSVVVTLSAPAPIAAASLSFFNVRIALPLRSFVTGNSWGSVITESLTPTEQSDYVLDLLTIGTTAGVTPNAGQTELYAEEIESTTAGAFTVASSYEYEAESDGAETIGWTAGGGSNWAYVAMAIEPRLFQNVYAEDHAPSADVAHPSGSPGHAADTATAVDSIGQVAQPAHAADTAAAVDSIHFTAPNAYTADVAVTIDSTHRVTPTASASDKAVLHDTVFRTRGTLELVADSALASDVATRLVHDFRLPVDYAQAWDYATQLAPVHALVNTTGVLGHLLLGWWVLGNKDAYVRGRDVSDTAVTTDVAHSASGLRPRPQDQALASDSVVRVAPHLRSAADSALAADQASPTRVQVGTAADAALASDSANDVVRLAVRKATDVALTTDSAHRQPPQPGHAGDAALADDVAAQVRRHLSAAADTALTTDAATGQYLMVAHDVALAADVASSARFRGAADTSLTTDLVVGALRQRPRAADVSLAVDAAVAASRPGRLAADQALATDSASKAQPRFVTDVALSSDTTTAGRPSVRIVTDLAFLSDAAAWSRGQPRTTTDFALATDQARGGRLVGTHDFALSFDTAVIGVRLPRLVPDSAPAFDRAASYFRAVARYLTFGRIQPAWRFGRIVTHARLHRAQDLIGRP